MSCTNFLVMYDNLFFMLLLFLRNDENVKLVPLLLHHSSPSPAFITNTHMAAEHVNTNKKQEH